MTLLDEQYAFRAALVERLEQDLVGPSGGPEEVLDDAPITTYASGILFPSAANQPNLEADVDDQGLAESDAGESAPDDPAVNLANIRYPSSMGFTFSVDRTTTTLSVEISAARYEPLDEAGDVRNDGDSPNPGEAEAGVSDADGDKRRSRWRRLPFSRTIDTVDVATPGEGRLPITDGLQLFYRVRRPDNDGVAVTLVLINTMKAPRPWARDATSWFQPRLVVTTPDDAGPMFVNREGPEPPAWDADLKSHRLLYRNATSMGVGHGCSVTWDLDSGVPGRCHRVETTFVPSFPLPLSVSNPDIPTSSLRFAGLARGDQKQALQSLGDLCDRYASWIDEARTAASELDPRLLEVANDHLAWCDEALGRMRKGIARLSDDAMCWTAFRIANEAMLLQRARGVWLAAGASPAEEPDVSADHGWRPFQIAFILLCLEGVADESSPDREVADLLWFPTGGGKTEAYLGLMAFTVALRRLRNPQAGHGVTALMRYTLRLLTIQQFERATMLICCLETIRRDRSDLGTEPISIGLWVGRAATPNDLAEARRAIDKLRKGTIPHEGNPLQLSRCPWCGTELDSRSLYIAKQTPRLVLACGSDGCEFKRGLPVHVVDEDIYNHHPTLVIATADKFASLPWTEHGRGLFNLDLPGVPPPSLIIQDELHLISGPLGTLAGLYEAAIDMLCTHEGRVPKVVASTATIRRASEQTMALFCREVRQFPPPGLDAGDSYFAVEAPPDKSGNRLYVGCMAPGTSHTTLMVRAYAGLLQGAAELAGPDVARDPYWTLVGYFNSLRVLGGARMQVQDDVNDRIELLANRSGRERREIERRVELTSRESSSDIPDHLQRMSVALPNSETLDVILATNMISVGVDIDRLGLMAVMGQPQSTSEYIQATSRVGRRHPGLVVDLLNASKSRDRSHYESFVDFHSALYRQVESSSVTPFSPRARDRGLHAVLIALARLTIPDLRENKSARDVAKVERQVRGLIPRLLERVRQVDPREAANTERQLSEIVDDWLARSRDEPNLVFRNHNDPQVSLLGDAAIPEADLLGAFPTLWSLRDVDQSSNLYLV